MELDDIKTIWNEYDKKLEKTLRLNMQLLRKINFDKVQQKSRKMLFMKLYEIAIYVALLILMVNFTVRYFTQPQFSLSGGFLAVILLVSVITVIRQLSLIIRLQTDLTSSVTALQRMVTSLKLMIVSYVKYSLFVIPLFPVMMIVGGKLLLHVDFTEPQRRAYFLSNIAAVEVLLPLVIWGFIELSKKEIKKTWVKQLLTGSGWNQANAASRFLAEIEEFERED
jgi:hypothetical protein